VASPLSAKTISVWRRGKRDAAARAPRGVDESLSSVAVHAFLRHRFGMVGLIITIAFMFVAVLASRLAPYNPLEIHDLDTLHRPSGAYLLGTDEFGRDILSRILVGSRISIGVGFVSIAMATMVGTAVGLVAGFSGGAFDSVSMRFFDAVLAFPAILLAIVIAAILGPGPVNAMLAVAIVNVPAFARLTRANVMKEKWKDYVEAARAVGASPGRIVIRGILPNTVSTVLVQITVSVAGAILLESSLSFLGLGAPPPAPSWGQMMSIGKGYLWTAPWYGIFPGMAIALLVLGLYLLGDGLADAIDPRRQRLI